MTRYIAQRLLVGLLTAFLVSLMLFTVLRVIPSVAPGWTDREYHEPILIIWCTGDCEFYNDVLDKFRKDLGLDQPPLHTQYLHWVGGWVIGYWGESRFSTENIDKPWVTSWSYGKSTFEAFKQRLPVTLQLVVMAQTLAALVGVSAGVIMALRRNTRIDHVGRTICKAGLALPVFWTATLLLVGGFYFVDWSPRVGHNPLLEDPLGNLDQFIFPAIALCYVSCAAVALMMRSSTLGILRQDYVQTTPVSGLAHSVAVFLHALKNVMEPAVVTIGFTFPAIVGGVLIIEPLFNLNGVGNMLIKAAVSADYPIVESLALFFTVWVVAVNTLVDLACGWLTPDVRSSRKPPREEWDHLANPVRLV